MTSRCVSHSIAGAEVRNQLFRHALEYAHGLTDIVTSDDVRRSLRRKGDDPRSEAVKYIVPRAQHIVAPHQLATLLRQIQLRKSGVSVGLSRARLRQTSLLVPALRRAAGLNRALQELDVSTDARGERVHTAIGARDDALLGKLLHAARRQVEQGGDLLNLGALAARLRPQP